MINAQLIEEGFEVHAHEGVPEALSTLAPEPKAPEAKALDAKLPDLILGDISASADPSADVEALSAWSHRIPIWIIASRTYIVEKGIRGHGFEMTFLRPVDVGELVNQIKQRLEKHLQP